MTLQDIKNYIIARIFPNTSQAITGATMQDTLLQMADSMNTPSGDPMHYAYEAVGAVYNASGADTTTTGVYGDTIVHKAGRWLLTEVGNLTNEDMCVVIANRTNWNASDLSTISAHSPARTVVPKTNWARAMSWYGTPLNIPMQAVFFSCANMETIQFSTGPDTYYRIQPTQFLVAFRACPKLTKILNVINCKSLQALTDAFYGCNSLVEVRLLGLKSDASFSDSPLSVASAVYMLQNADATATFTITFRADRQAIFEANTDFVNAKNAKPNITILYQ